MGITKEKKIFYIRLSLFAINCSEIRIKSVSRYNLACTANTVHKMEISETKEMESESPAANAGTSSEGQSQSHKLLQCAICWNPPTDCRLCPQCSGLACYGCLETWYFKYMPHGISSSGTCPMCQFPVHLKAFVPAPWIQHLVTQFAGRPITDEIISVFEQIKRNILNSSQDSRCKIHPLKTMELYCTRCRETVCVECSLWGAHYMHDVKTIAKMRENEKSDLQRERQRRAILSSAQGRSVRR